MALKIRLRQQGKRNQLTYRVVVADAKLPRDGRYVEMVGWYDPFESNGKLCSLKTDRIQYWMSLGAQLTEKTRSLVQREAPDLLKELQNRQAEKKLKQRAKKKTAATKKD